MAFSAENLKEAGSWGNFVGGQLFLMSDEDSTLETMLADSYLDDGAESLRVGDNVLMRGSDGNTLARIDSITSGVVVTTVVAPASQAAQSLSGAGAANITSLVTLHTSGAADVVTLADGNYVGHMKVITCVVDGGSTIITPATMLTLSTVTLVAAGDTAVLMWTGAGGWTTIGVAGTVFSVSA